MVARSRLVEPPARKHWAEHRYRIADTGTGFVVDQKMVPVRPHLALARQVGCKGDTGSTQALVGLPQREHTSPAAATRLLVADSYCLLGGYYPVRVALTLR